MIGVVRPDGRQEQVNVKQVFHGKSARASFRAASLIGRSRTPTLYLPRFSIFTRACRGSTGSSLVRTSFPSPENCTSNKSPGLADGRTTRRLLSAVTFTVGPSHRLCHNATCFLFLWTGGFWRALRARFRRHSRHLCRYSNSVTVLIQPPGGPRPLHFNFVAIFVGNFIDTSLTAWCASRNERMARSAASCRARMRGYGTQLPWLIPARFGTHRIRFPA